MVSRSVTSQNSVSVNVVGVIRTPRDMILGDKYFIKILHKTQSRA